MLQGLKYRNGILFLLQSPLLFSRPKSRGSSLKVGFSFSQAYIGVAVRLLKPGLIQNFNQSKCALGTMDFNIIICKEFYKFLDVCITVSDLQVAHAQYVNVVQS